MRGTSVALQGGGRQYRNRRLVRRSEMRMPVIAAAVGGLALGAFVVAGSRYMTSPVQASIPAPSREPVAYRTAPAEPAYRTAPSEPVHNGRSWKKSALIIGGSAAGGAGIGAIVGGKSGAVKGAVLGGVAGTVYDIATRNK